MIRGSSHGSGHWDVKADDTIIGLMIFSLFALALSFSFLAWKVYKEKKYLTPDYGKSKLKDAVHGNREHRRKTEKLKELEEIKARLVSDATERRLKPTLPS